MIYIPEVTNFMLFKFTDNLNLGEAANTPQERNIKESCEGAKESTKRFSSRNNVTCWYYTEEIYLPGKQTEGRNNRNIQHYRRVTIQLNAQPYIVWVQGNLRVQSTVQPLATKNNVFHLTTYPTPPCLLPFSTPLLVTSVLCFILTTSPCPQHCCVC